MEQQREAAARLAGELEAARRIQMGTLPRAAAAFPGETRFDLYAMLEPAREVGGDLYDFFLLDADHLFFMIGDVSGKGLPGSLFMAISKALYKSTALRRHGQVAVMMREADAEISRDNAEGLFVTVLAGILDARTGELEYCSAGHEPPLLLPRGGRALAAPGRGRGPAALRGGRLSLRAGRRAGSSPGDTLCLITDGITEAAGPDGQLYGRERLEALLGRLGRRGERGRGGGGDPPRRGRLHRRHRALGRHGGPGPALHRPPVSLPSGEGRVRGGRPTALPDVDLHPPVPRLRDLVRRRHERLALPAPRHPDALGRDADLHQLVAHPLGAPERERVVVGTAPTRSVWPMTTISGAGRRAISSTMRPRSCRESGVSSSRPSRK